MTFPFEPFHVRTEDEIVHEHAPDVMPSAQFRDGSRYVYIKCARQGARRRLVAPLQCTQDSVTCIVCLSL